jgi:hypothetical membrane protein
MGAVRAHRYRWGALAWLLTLQFFVLETIAQVSSAFPYSRGSEAISVLGASAWPAHAAMDASLIAQGVLVAAGLVLLRPALLGGARRAVPVLLGLASLGAVVAGAVPQDVVHPLHVTGVLLYLAGGSLGLLGLAYAVRPRSEALGTALAVLGLVAAATTVFFVMGVTSYLGTGGTERVAAYLVPVGLALTGAGIWRLAGSGPDADSRRPDVPTRRQLREEERAERARMERERDAALEASLESKAAGHDDELDPDDPWAPQRRRD